MTTMCVWPLRILNLWQFLVPAFHVGVIFCLIIAVWSQPLPGMVKSMNLSVRFFLFLRKTQAAIFFFLVFFTWQLGWKLKTFSQSYNLHQRLNVVYIVRIKALHVYLLSLFAQVMAFRNAW